MKATFTFILGFAMTGVLSAQPTVKKETLTYKNQEFEVLHILADNPLRTVLFSVGSGGNPERHLPLLRSLADHNITVIAPFFQRITSPLPTEDELRSRASHLLTALSSLADTNLDISGVGHSIGATLLIGLAGGELWLGPNQQVKVSNDTQFERLVLMCPPTGFFRAPSALDNFTTPFQAWAGSKDPITPPSQIDFLSQMLGSLVAIDIRVEEEAGHFTFMNTLPPNVTDPHPNREMFLNRLATQILDYITM